MFGDSEGYAHIIIISFPTELELTHRFTFPLINWVSMNLCMFLLVAAGEDNEYVLKHFIFTGKQVNYVTDMTVI